MRTEMDRWELRSRAGFVDNLSWSVPLNALAVNPGIPGPRSLRRCKKSPQGDLQGSAHNFAKHPELWRGVNCWVVGSQSSEREGLRRRIGIWHHPSQQPIILWILPLRPGYSRVMKTSELKGSASE